VADYFTEFSLVVDISEPEKHWIDRYLHLSKILVDESSYELIKVVHWESNSKDADYEAWFYSYGHEYSSLNGLCELLRRFLIKFDRDDVLALQWSSSCSKPRTDAFGGGAVVISQLGITYINTHVWAEEVAQLARKRLIDDRRAIEKGG